MFEQANYTHPEAEPLFSGSWMEVVFSWLIGAAVVVTVLVLL